MHRDIQPPTITGRPSGFVDLDPNAPAAGRCTSPNVHREGINRIRDLRSLWRAAVGHVRMVAVQFPVIGGISLHPAHAKAHSNWTRAQWLRNGIPVRHNDQRLRRGLGRRTNDKGTQQRNHKGYRRLGAMTWR